MKTYSLFWALLISLGGGSVWAQAAGNPPPPKIVAEVSSSNQSTTKPAAAKPLGTKVDKAKPATPETTAKPKASPAATTTASAETKSEPKAAPAQSPAVSTETKPESSDRLPFKLNDRPEAVPQAPSLTGLLLRTFGALLFIVGLIAAVGWALRYFGIINFGKPQSETAGLKVINTLPLGERRSLMTVKFGERTLLIGATPQGLTLLAEQAEQHEEPELPGNYVPMPTMQTVTDLLGVRAGYQFEDEMAQATLADSAWHSRSMR